MQDSQDVGSASLSLSQVKDEIAAELTGNACAGGRPIAGWRVRVAAKGDSKKFCGPGIE